MNSGEKNPKDLKLSSPEEVAKVMAQVEPVRWSTRRKVILVAVITLLMLVVSYGMGKQAGVRAEFLRNEFEDFLNSYRSSLMQLRIVSIESTVTDYEVYLNGVDMEFEIIQAVSRNGYESKYLKARYDRAVKNHDRIKELLKYVYEEGGFRGKDTDDNVRRALREAESLFF